MNVIVYEKVMKCIHKQLCIIRSIAYIYINNDWLFQNDPIIQNGICKIVCRIVDFSNFKHINLESQSKLIII